MSAELHPPAETLADYAAGALDEEGTERVREHLAECSHCTRIVLDLTSREGPGQRRVADPELAAAWRSHLAHRARDEAREDRAGVQAGVRDHGREPGRWWPRVPAPVAAALLLTLGLLTGVFVGRYGSARGPLEVPGELRQPVLAVPGLELLPEGSLRGGAPEPRLAPPHDAVLFTLTLVLLDPSELPRSGRYELEIHRTAAENDKPVWRGTGRLEEGGDRPPGHLTVVLPRDLLPPGRYRLVLREAGSSSSGSSGAGEALATYRFRLSSPGEGAGRSP